MFKSVISFTVLLSVVLSQKTGLYKLNILHYNDFHAHFEEISPRGGVCGPSESCIGGFARLYTAVKQALEDEPASLLLNAGDTFQGTIWYNFLRWNVTQHFMNMLPHDAHVLGNHEFDHSVEGLLPYLERLNSPMLGANVNTTYEPELGAYVKNHVVVTRGEKKIGIIGVLLRQFSAPKGKVIMEDELEAVNREVAILTAGKVDIIILLSHVGYTSDLNLARRISPNVDIIVGGHSHTLLYNSETPDGNSPLGEYPTIVTRDDGHRILVVQAYCYTRYLGNIKLYFNDQGVIETWEGQPIYLGTSIIQDLHIMEELKPWREKVDTVGKEVLGRSLVTLSRSCFDSECNLGNWVCDGLLEQVMVRAKGNAWNDAHVCIINAGGLRMPIDRGNVTTEALLMSLPFENYVQVYDLQGKYLLEALEFSVGPVQTPGSFYSRRMLQFGGMRVVYNASAAAGSRVVSARVRCIECDVPRYEPLVLNKTYRVLSQSYIGDGGGGYTMLSQNRENLENLDVDYVMLQRHMRKQDSVVQDLDGRIEILF